jgi:hypothetical protein
MLRGMRRNRWAETHIKAFTVWMAGGGAKPGISMGQTDISASIALRSQCPLTTSTRPLCIYSVSTILADLQIQRSEFPLNGC